MIVEYPCRDAALNVVPENALVQSDEISPQQMLQVQRVVQQYWADNSISFTVNFDPKRYGPADVRTALERHGRHLKGTTFMPEGSYRQAPIERLSEAPEEAQEASGAEECVGACPIR
jgi:ribonucleotide reductase alpha subunit